MTATTKEGALDNLAWSLKTLCDTNQDGSEATKAQRKSGLILVAGDLRSLGYNLPSAASMKPKHVSALVKLWRGQGISDATLKNRMCWLRWWAVKAGKPGLVPRDNTELGIGTKATFKGQRAAATALDRLDALPERMALAIRLQMAFGLRLEESLKFRPEDADKGTYIALAPSWCKGGRPRAVPIVHDRQRDLVDELHRVCGDGSLIPAGMTYIQFRKQVEHATLSAGIANMHKHRHWYACWRYRTLAGVKAPAEGGPLHSALPPAERLRLDEIRLQVSRELGHNRIDVTDAYLGSRWGRGAAK